MRLIFFFIILVIFFQCSNKKSKHFETSWSIYESETLDNLNLFPTFENETLVSCKKFILQLDYESALNCFTKTNATDLEYILLLFLEADILINTTQQTNKLFKIISNLEAAIIFENTFNSHKIYIEYLRIKAQVYKSNNLTFKALSTIHFALNIIENSTYSDKLDTSKAKLLALKGSILIDERGENFKVAKKCFHESNKYLNELQYPKQMGLNYLNLYYLLIQNGYTDEASKALNLVSDIAQTGPLFLKMYFNINKGFESFKNGKQSKGFEYLNNSLTFILKNNCNRFRLAIYSYITEEYLNLEYADSALIYLNKFDEFKTCDDSFQKWAEFYRSELEHQYVSLKKKNSTAVNSIASILLKRRILAKKIFPNKSEFHLGDFYAQNTGQIIDAFLSNENSQAPYKYIDTIRHLFNDTKAKSESLANYSEDKSERKFLSNLQANKQLDIYLREINDFKDTSNYERVVYKKIYELLESLDDADNSNAYIPVALNDDSTPILHTLKYQNNYYSYLYYHNKIQLHKVTEAVVSDYMGYVNRTNKYLKPHNKDSLKYYKHLLLPDTLSRLNEVRIIADGLFDFIPIEILYSENPNFKVHYDIRDRTFDSQVTKINKESTAVFSFSDLNTINSGEVKEVSDLHNGHLECNEIANLFSQAQLYSGFDCTIDNLKESDKADILHISTHGIINTNKRGDNYLLFRRKSKEMDSLFISDVSLLDLEAKFVSLAACETTKGMHIDGSGVFSLSKAFLKSGTQTVLKTLWKVDDKSTKEFMVKFYENWLTGVSVLDAQHQAKQYMRDSTEYAHPYYWAGFVLEGNPSLYLK